ncbi:MAG: tRNA (adenosine(37)-N6)-threonylcarbamoyltransferase complex ATPase subunit type 1 TsaE [bacterium]
MRETITGSPQATAALGEKLARALPPGTVILLNGDLGGGKTTFVGGLARGLKATQEVRSPSFTLVREYGPLVHMDLYRLDAAEAAGLGWEDYLDDKRIVAVEWSSHLPTGFWGKGSFLIKLYFEIVDEKRRRIVLKCGESVAAKRRHQLERLFCV